MAHATVLPSNCWDNRVIKGIPLKHLFKQSAGDPLIPGSGLMAQGNKKEEDDDDAAEMKMI